MNSIVSVAMKAGTFSCVTSTPLTSPMATPATTAARIAHPTGRSKCDGAYAMEKTVATRPRMEPTDRSSSLLTITKVMPTAITPNRAVSRRTAENASVVPKKAGLIQTPTR